MNDDIREQLLTGSNRGVLRKRIEQAEIGCRRQLRCKLPPRQFQNLMAHVQALNAAMTILNTLEAE